MKRRTLCLTVVVVTLFALVATSQVSVACTGIHIKPKDGSVIAARTLEFGTDLHSNVIVIPRGLEFIGTTPDGKPGLRWKVKYGCVGANLYDLPVIMDGINEKGLSVGLFYFPGYTKYQKIQSNDVDKAIAPWQLLSYLLCTCKDANEAAGAAKAVRIGPVFLKPMGMIPELHFLVKDAQGRCAVMECIDGELKIHNNPLGVLTNAPTFDWHVTNLCNYVNLQPNDVVPISMSGIKINGFGQGTGMLGLPGDFTPPSRFVQAVEFSQSALPVDTAREGVLQAFHILNQFDIPKGSVREISNGRTSADFTRWTSASDLTNRRYFFRTYENSQIRMVDLQKVDLDARAIKVISMAGPEVIEDLSSKAK